MHFRAITRIVGLLVILFSGTMIIPGLVALIYRDGAGRAFTQTFFVALAIGSILWWPNRKEKGELKSREGFLIVVLFWTVLGSVGALPFIFSESPNLTITDAFFTLNIRLFVSELLSPRSIVKVTFDNAEDKGATNP